MFLLILNNTNKLNIVFCSTVRKGRSHCSSFMHQFIWSGNIILAASQHYFCQLATVIVRTGSINGCSIHLFTHTLITVTTFYSTSKCPYPVHNLHTNTRKNLQVSAISFPLAFSYVTKYHPDLHYYICFVFPSIDIGFYQAAWLHPAVTLSPLVIGGRWRSWVFAIPNLSHAQDAAWLMTSLSLTFSVADKDIWRMCSASPLW